VIDCAFVVPGTWETRTGGYGYDRRILALLPQAGIRVTPMQIPGAYPTPSDKDLHETGARLRALPAKTVLLIDGLAYGALPPAIVTSLAGPIIALVHHPLSLETGLEADRKARLAASEKQALALADHVIVTSATTAGILYGQFDVPKARIDVAWPGTDQAPRSRASLQIDPAVVRLLAVGSLVPRKGYDVLLAALAKIVSDRVSLTIAGSLDRDRQSSERLRAQIAALGLQRSVRLAGELDDDALAMAYDASHIFVMPSLFEGYGMALAEAMARGLAIVTTPSGALAETASDPAIVKVEAGSSEALAAALAALLGDDTERRRRSALIWQAAQALPTWQAAADVIAARIKRLAP
jgi:glycosyltransferase involved in cell wall biosynthesis